MKIKTMRRRGTAAFAVIAILFIAVAVRLFWVQVLSNDTGTAEAAVSTVEVPIAPIRGLIYDRNGELLVTNKQINTVIIDYLSFPEGSDFDGRNEVLLKLIEFFEKYNVEWIDDLPLEVKNDKITFAKDKDSETAYLKSSAFLNLNYYATAQNCFDALVERYHLQDYPAEKARKIASVYYSMRKNGFNASTPYVFAREVNDDFIVVIKENSFTYQGVDVSVESERAYTDGTIAPHIVGVVGKLTQEEYEAKKDDGYAMNDVIGKTGVEYTYEELLRGKAGKKLVSIDADGNRTETVIEKPVNGAAIVLTIDKKIQKTAQKALKEHIAKEQLTRDVTCGSVVAMDTSNNAVLAIASYPDFNLETYFDDYDTLAQDKAKPLWNRALRSVYTPGSTIKPCVAMAGLEEGAIDSTTRIRCTGRYTYYQDYQPGCTGRHGYQDVINAIYHSCNIFFYETSRRLGIDTMNKYFTVFGLGEKSGVELAESSGQVDSPTFRSSIGDRWTPGLTIQAGIGHGDNNFTPIQMCSYVSTIANKGVRYRAHLIKTIKSADYSETIVDNTDGEVLSKASFSDANWDLVYRGMLLVGTKGAGNFPSVPHQVGAKTGTTTVVKKINGHKRDTYNGLIIAFAPYENPQVCCSVVIEGAGSGGSTSPVANAVMAEFFNGEEHIDTFTPENELIE